MKNIVVPYGKDFQRDKIQEDINVEFIDYPEESASEDDTSYKTI